MIINYKNKKDQYSTSYFFDLSYTNTKKSRIHILFFRFILYEYKKE